MSQVNEGNGVVRMPLKKKRKKERYRTSILICVLTDVGYIGTLPTLCWTLINMS